MSRFSGRWGANRPRVLSMSQWDRKDIFKLALSLLFIGAFILLFLPFTAEILLAAIFALAMEPFLGRWLQPKHLRYKTSVALILIGMFFVLALPVTMVIYKAYRYMLEISKNGVQNSELFQKLSAMKTWLASSVDKVTEKVGLNERFDLSGLLDEALNHSANSAVQYATTFASNIPGLLISLFIFCAALYFFLAEARWLRNAFLRQKLVNQTEANDLVEVLQKSSYSTVVMSMVIALIQATIVAIGSLIFSAGDIAVVWVATFFLSFIPVIGAAPVALFLAAFQIVMGSYGAAIGLVVVAVIAGTTDNLVRPYLLSSDQDLHPVLALLAIIGAVIVFGMPGLFLGPVIASVAIKIVPTLYGTEPATESVKDRKKK